MAGRDARSKQGNLPAELTSFIGCRPELAKIKRLLTRTRLLTLTGSGGAGKTRLARRAADEMARNFPDGVWLVSLAPLDGPPRAVSPWWVSSAKPAVYLGLTRRGVPATTPGGQLHDVVIQLAAEERFAGGAGGRLCTDRLVLAAISRALLCLPGRVPDLALSCFGTCSGGGGRRVSGELGLAPISPAER